MMVCPSSLRVSSDRSTWFLPTMPRARFPWKAPADALPCATSIQSCLQSRRRSRFDISVEQTSDCPAPLRVGVCQDAGVAPRTSPSVADALARLSAQGREDRLRHLEVLPPREGRVTAWPEWVDDGLVQAWRARGIERPWSHQVAAAQAAYDG